MTIVLTVRWEELRCGVVLLSVFGSSSSFMSLFRSWVRFSSVMLCFTGFVRVAWGVVRVVDGLSCAVTVISCLAGLLCGHSIHNANDAPHVMTHW